MSGRLTRFAHSEDILLVQYGEKKPGEYAGKFAWIADGETHYLGFAVTSDIFVAGVCVLRARKILSESLAALDESGKPRGYFVPPPAVDFLYSFLDSLNDRLLRPERMEQASLRFCEDPAGAKTGLERHFSTNEVERIAQAMESNDWEALSKVRLHFKRRLAVRGLPRRVIMKLKSALDRPQGMLVACIGPQGSGRATVVERIEAALASAFALDSPPSRPEALVNHVEANLPGRAMRARHFVREFATLTALKFRTRFLGQTIVMSPSLSSNVLGAAESRARPQPDLWIVLDAPPEKLQARKSKVTHADSSRERDECLNWVAAKHNAVVLDAGQPLERVAAEAVAAILELASERTAARTR
ncbi:MAG: hypothetical protein ACREV2_19820, partial [Burkholderiales bacterium]